MLISEKAKILFNENKTKTKTSIEIEKLKNEIQTINDKY